MVTGIRKLIQTLTAMVLIALLGAFVGSPDEAMQWIVIALAAGVGGNGIEHLAPVLARRRPPVSAPAADSLPVASPAAGAGTS